jgi:hypothetical protein
VLAGARPANPAGPALARRPALLALRRARAIKSPALLKRGRRWGRSGRARCCRPVVPRSS